MSELWLPNDNKMPDASNVFEMAKLLQQNLTEILDFEEYVQFQLFAVEGLRMHIKQNESQQQEFSVDTAVGLLEDRSNTPVASIENARFYGMVSDAAMLEKANFRLGLAIRMDAFSFAPLNNVNDTNEMYQTVSLPVSTIHQADPVG